MKKTIVLLLCIFFNSMLVFGQGESKENDEAVLKIKKQAEDKIPYQKAKLKVDNPDIGDWELNFSLDTFRIEQINNLRQGMDFSNTGIISAIEEHSTSYDKLMIKYYDLLKDKLNSKDRAVLSKAQKSWLAFRDNETKLFKMMQEPDYTGEEAEKIFDYYAEIDGMVQTRATEIFNYYSTIMYQQSGE